MIHGKKEFLKYSVVQEKAVNGLGCLKKCFVGGTKSWIYALGLDFRGLSKTSINVSSNVCDVNALGLIPSRVFNKTNLS